MSEFDFFNARVVTNGGLIKAVPRYDIDLDLPPLERWREVGTLYKDKYLEAKKYLLSQVLGPDADCTKLPWYVQFVGYLAHLCASKPNKEEMSAFASITNSTAGEIALMNYLYEMSAKCSAFVANSPTGTPLHGRCLDWAANDMLCQTTIHLRVHRKGRILYECMTWPGYLGVLTAVAPGRFSVSVNFRDVDRVQAPGPLGTHEVLRRAWASLVGAVRGAQSVGFLLRSVLEDPNGSSSDFASAAQALATVPIVAPVYFMMAGPLHGQGLVLVRGPADSLRSCDSFKSRIASISSIASKGRDPLNAVDVDAPLSSDKDQESTFSSSSSSVLRILGDPKWTAGGFLLYLANHDLGVGCSKADIKRLRAIEESDSFAGFCVSWDRIAAAQKYASTRCDRSTTPTTVVMGVADCVDLLCTKPIVNCCTVYQCVLDPSVGAQTPLHCARHEKTDDDNQIVLPRRRPEADWLKAIAAIGSGSSGGDARAAEPVEEKVVVKKRSKSSRRNRVTTGI